MVVALTLKTVITLAPTPPLNARANPAEHFRAFFMPLFGLAEQRGDPVAAVDAIASFFKVLVVGSRYLQVRLQRYLWARRTLTQFLRGVVRRRRRRLQNAVQKWTAMEPEGLSLVVPEASLGRHRRRSPQRFPPSSAVDAARPAAVPPPLKLAALASLHRTVLHGVILDSRSGIRHTRQLADDLRLISQRIATLWLQGGHGSLEVQQLVARLFGLRQRVQSYTSTPMSSFDALWERLTSEDWRTRHLELLAKEEKKAQADRAERARTQAPEASPPEAPSSSTDAPRASDSPIRRQQKRETEPGITRPSASANLSTLRALKAERNGGRDSTSSTTPLSPDTPGSPQSPTANLTVTFGGGELLKRRAVSMRQMTLVKKDETCSIGGGPKRRTNSPPSPSTPSVPVHSIPRAFTTLEVDHSPKGRGVHPGKGADVVSIRDVFERLTREACGPAAGDGGGGGGG
eukprot:EG_transcript_12287